jgi:hypothetical protein
MRRWLVALTVATLTALLWLAWSGSAQSQAEMSFFVTSTGNGADARCQSLGDAAGATDGPGARTSARRPSPGSGAAGTLYFDEFVSKPQTYIGR